MSDATEVVNRFVAGVDREGLGAYGVHVLIGEEAAEHRWRSNDRECIYSVSKGVAVLAAGIAADEGLLSLRTKVAELLPDITYGAGVEEVTLEDLLTMSSGIDFPWFADEPVPWPDLAQEMLGRPTKGPKSGFQYTDASTYVAMRMLGSVVGDVRDWLMPRLFGPLGIHNPQWHRCPLGWIMAGSGLELRTEELSRIGRLLRDGGVWQGERLVSAEWIERMHSHWVDSGRPAPANQYGLAVWNGPGPCWRLAGRYGQFVIVNEERDAVVTITAHEEANDPGLVAIAVAALG